MQYTTDAIIKYRYEPERIMLNTLEKMHRYLIAFLLKSCSRRKEKAIKEILPEYNVFPFNPPNLAMVSPCRTVGISAQGTLKPISSKMLVNRSAKKIKKELYFRTFNA